jgi:hypothetical protein
MTTVSRRLGELLVALAGIGRDVVDRALSAQRTSGGRLGDILVGLGLVPEDHVAAALTMQAGAAPVERRRRLGDILVSLGQLSAATLDTVLGGRRGDRERLGEKLLRLGLVSEAAVRAALRIQRDESSSLAELLRRTGVVDDDQLAYALALQERTGRRLGETLVDLGHVDRASIDRALRLQELLRGGASVASIAIALTVATPGIAAAGGAGKAGESSTASSTVSLVIPERVTVDVATSDESGVAVVDGAFDRRIGGASYLNGATTVRVAGGGDDGGFALASPSGGRISFRLRAGDGTRLVRPGEHLEADDFRSLRVELVPDASVAATPLPATEGAGEVYSGVLTVTVNPT